MAENCFDMAWRKFPKHVVEQTIPPPYDTCAFR